MDLTPVFTRVFSYYRGVTTSKGVLNDVVFNDSTHENTSFDTMIEILKGVSRINVIG